MKRILSIAGILMAGVVLLGVAQTKRQRATDALRVLDGKRAEADVALSAEKVERARLLEEASARGAVPVASSPANRFSPELAEWMAAGNFAEAPPTLIPELRKALGLAEDFLSDYVFVSKASMHNLRPPSPGHNDKLGDAFCALLSIGPEQKTKIESSLASARQQFSNWAKENVQRDAADGETVVRYTLPAATDFADGVTNNLMTTIGDTLGAQRTALFRTYADTWFQIEMGYVGGVTNTLAVLRKPKENGDLALYYQLKREGVNSSMSEGPAEIQSKYFPPAWRNVFVGGWAEVGEREGLSFNTGPKK
jgi:hypothetical protein